MNFIAATICFLLIDFPHYLVQLPQAINIVSSLEEVKKLILKGKKRNIWFYEKNGLQFKDHVEHSIRAVRLQQLHDVGVLEHVTDTGLTLQV